MVWQTWKRWFLMLLVALSVSACFSVNDPSTFPEEVEGFRPIYSNKPPKNEIVVLNDVPLQQAGKIYVYGDLLLVNEPAKGIHVFDNANPADPQKLYFIQVKGCYDIAVKDGVIYADNLTDLALIKISRQGLEETKRIENVFEDRNLSLPPRGGYFECVDPSKGFLVGWEEALLKKPECFR